jgi:hypothetical protein
MSFSQEKGVREAWRDLLRVMGDQKQGRGVAVTCEPLKKTQERLSGDRIES